MISRGQSRCHQNRAFSENPRDPSRLVSPNVARAWTHLIMWPSGDAHIMVGLFMQSNKNLISSFRLDGKLKLSRALYFICMAFLTAKFISGRSSVNVANIFLVCLISSWKYCDFLMRRSGYSIRSMQWSCSMAH